MNVFDCETPQPGVARREFMTWSIGGGLALALAPSAFAVGPVQAPVHVSPWITLHRDGRATLVSTSLEMGQGSRTGQVQLLADELDLPWDAIDVELAAERDPFLVEGALFSGGSETVRTRFDILRRAGATVRHQLRIAAANAWNVPIAECEGVLGRVVHAPSGRSGTYGEFAAAAAAIAPPAVTLKQLDEYRYIGKPLPTLRQRDKVTGAARYGLDFRLPGMLVGALRQCPEFGGALAGVDDAPALAIAGVRRVIRLKDALAVIADNTYAAMKGASALDPKWSVAAPVPDTGEIERRLASAIDAPDALVVPNETGRDMRGRLRSSFASAARRHETTYELAYLAHAPLEPMNATARPTANGVEIWAPCQAPTWAREEVAAATGIAKENIVIHPLLMGGGFGRRLKGDYAARAAEVALAAGAAVKVVWTREEDMTHDFYRPAMRMTVRAAIPDGGVIDGYEVLAATADDRTGGSGPAPYAIGSYAATLSNVKVGVPVGAWRAVDPGMALFARESFIDECAAIAGIDPLAYRLRLLGTNVRARRLLEAAAKAIDWSRARPRGVGCGLAILEGWDTLVAHAVEVSLSGGALRVERIVAAADCGTAVNPQQVRAQFEGGAIMGLSAALGEAVTMRAGRVEQTNFDSYDIMRIDRAPRIDVLLFESPEAVVGGAGEPPVPGIAPALANAVVAAGGKRIRKLPFADQLA